MAGAPDAPNTLRLVVSEPRRSDVGLFFIQKDLIEDFLGMARESIFCMQCFPSTGLNDVTFWKREDLQTCLLRKGEKEDEEMLQGITFLSSETKTRIPITVHMFNPFVRDEEIRAFLLRYCDSVSACTKLKNVLGTFNGHRRFWVILRADDGGIGGVKHPPQSFSIGSNRGYLFYPGQPSFCRQCYSFGHTKDQCESGQVCRNCFARGHGSAECPVGKRCHICGSDAHLARQCPKVSEATAKAASRGEETDRGAERGALSYADVARGAAPVNVGVSGEGTKGLSEDGAERVSSCQPAEDEPGPSPVDAGQVEGTSAVVEESVPGHLQAEGDENETESEEEDMELGQASLKRKLAVPESPSQEIGTFPDSVSSHELVIDSDSSQAAHGSTGQAAGLQEGKGHGRPKEKVKRTEEGMPGMAGVNPEGGPRTRGRARGKSQKKDR